MRRALLLCPLLLAALKADGPSAVGYASLQGYTGLLNIPDALVTPEGFLTASYHNAIDPRWGAQTRWWDNHLWTFGVLPYAEVGMRFTEARPGIRDLSMHGKVQIPGLPEWGPRVAIGNQDYPGAVPYFRTTYIVATQSLGPARITLGHGRGPQRMKGTFGGVDLHVADWMQVLAEHDTLNRNVGLRLSLPERWLPDGVRLGGLVKRAVGLKEGSRSDVQVFARIPLGRAVARRQQALETRGAAPALAAPAAAPSPAPSATPLARVLAGQGFELVQVGTAGRTLVVRLENSRYNHSELDGLGVALGLAVRHAPDTTQAIRVELLNHGLRVLTVEAPAPLLRTYLLGSEEAARAVERTLAERLEASGPGTRPAAGEAAFEAPPLNGRALRPRIQLYPGYAMNVGTEIGAFDYRLSLMADALVPLWTGAGLNARWDIPVARSENYRPGAFFDTRGTHTRLDRLMLQQALPVAPGLVTQFAAGQYLHGLKGWMNQTVWSPGQGTHQLQLTGGRLRNEDRQEQEILVGTYRLYLAGLDSHVQLSYGTFQNQDTGYRVDLQRHFGDTTLSFFYARTTFGMAGFSLTVPLTPRRDMKPGVLQVRGTDACRWGLSSTLHTPNYNPMVPGLAEQPTQPHGLQEDLLDHGRLKGRYLRAHLERLREAFLRFAPTS